MNDQRTPAAAGASGFCVVRAIAKRDARSWFGNPAGYVFITIFVVLSALFLFSDAFFQNNSASLDSLNAVFPLLLVVLIPAVTMSIWAGERASGTDELLLTLPASDLHIVLGKFLAAAAIYTATLAFTIPQVVLLWFLGNPDGFLIVSNYLGYWLLGLALIGAGMIGSQLSANLTVSFILGAVFCAMVVYAEHIFGLFSIDLVRAWLLNFPVALFGEMSRGLVSISALMLYGGMIAAFLYFNLLLLSRRHWRGDEALHLGLRLVSLGVIVLAATLFMSNVGGKVDATSEGIHSLSQQTESILDGLDAERPVNIEAYLSTDVPKQFVTVRRDVENLLRRYESKGGGKVRVRLIECERFSEEARAAEQKYGLRAAPLMGEEGGTERPYWVYLGIAFTCGAEETVIPFLSNRLSVEYELTRSIRTVSQAQRRKLGVLKTDVDVMGGFDMAAMRPMPAWQVVEELKLQYEVVQVDPEKDYPADLDVLLAPLANTLPQAQLERFGSYIKAGHPVVWLDDPLPVSALGHGAGDRRQSRNQNPMFGGMQQDQPEPKGDFSGLLNELGIRWPASNIVWDSYNPEVRLENRVSPAIVFVGKDSRGRQPFNAQEAITSGLQELAVIWGGEVESSGASGLQFRGLLGSSPNSGTTPAQTFMQPNMFGSPQFNGQARIRGRANPDRTMACRVQGKLKPEDAKPIDLVFVADVDLISDQLFAFRAGSGAGLDLDNVTFILNCIDELAGDRAFVELRKRRPLQRTLTAIESRTDVSKRAWLEEKERAEEAAQKALEEAQGRLDAAVQKIKDATELDQESKGIQIEAVQEVENRRFNLLKAQIEDEKERKIEEAEATKNREQRSIQGFYTWLGIGISPVLSVLVGLLVFISKRAREREAIPAVRIKGGVA